MEAENQDKLSLEELLAHFALFTAQDDDDEKNVVKVMTIHTAKGLEFDQVFGVFPKKENPMTGQAKYICATRALHELYMYERA